MSLPTHEKSARRLPRGIWVLGIVSLLMDTSSEAIHALLPVFLVSVLGASTTVVGAIEGIAQATASIMKVFSGWLSDRLGARKTLTVIGYGLAALSKPLFALAASPAWVLAARFTDRIGKGIRGAPRDAMIGDMTPPELRGAAYGLRQSLDTVGAFLGPLAAIGLLMLLDGDVRAVFWIAAIPAVAAVVLLIVAVREPERKTDGPAQARPKPSLKGLSRMGGAFWLVAAAGGGLTLARFSEAFLVLRAEEQGLTLTLVPLVLIVMNVVYALSAYPAGLLSDRWGRRGLLVAGFLTLVVADLVLAFAPGLMAVMAGVALWGLHMGLTQGILAALVADAAPESLRATAFGIFHMISGVALLAASVIAGVLWDVYGPQATFMAGAAIAAAGLAWVALVMRPEAPAGAR